MTLKTDPVLFDRALVAAEPRLAWWRDSAALNPENKGMRDEALSFERAARVKVRRVLAALNGVDVESEKAEWIADDMIAMVLPRELVDRIRTAMLTEAASKAIAAEIGETAMAELLGDIAGLC